RPRGRPVSALRSCSATRRTTRASASYRPRPATASGPRSHGRTTPSWRCPWTTPYRRGARSVTRRPSASTERGGAAVRSPLLPLGPGIAGDDLQARTASARLGQREADRTGLPGGRVQAQRHLWDVRRQGLAVLVAPGAGPVRAGHDHDRAGRPVGTGQAVGAE